MRKTKRLFMIILIIGFCYYVSLPDYFVFNSTSFSNQDTRDTKLDVIVYQYFNIDELVQEIKKEHELINGVPTTLEINMYYSKGHYRSDIEPFETVLFGNESVKFK